MSSVNKVILIGNLGRDPESRTFASGDKVVSFSLATTESWRDKATGERKDKTEWHNVSVFNENIGRVVEQYCRKGSKVYLEGAIQTRRYEDKNGVEKMATEIVLQKFRGELTLLDSSKDAPQQAKPARGGSANRIAADLNDEVPFMPEWR